MEDKELFDFFKNKSASFDERPSEELWNKIQANMEASKSTPSFSILKIIVGSVLIVATATAIVFLTKTDSKKAFEKTNLNLQKNKSTEEVDSSKTLKISSKTETDSIPNTIETSKDTLKPKKIFVLKSIVTVKNDTVSIIKKQELLFKNDSLKIRNIRIAVDSLKIRPQVKGNRLLYETKKALTKIKFDSLVIKIIKETESNYGALVVIKAKGNKPYRHIVKFPEKVNLPRTTIHPGYYKATVVYDSLQLNSGLLTPIITQPPVLLYESEKPGDSLNPKLKK